MYNITLKNVPDELYGKLKKVAENNRRSMNNEIIHRLDGTFASSRIDVEPYLNRLAHFQSTLNTPLLTDDIINEAKEDGRS